MKLNFLSKMAIAVLVFIAIVLSKAFSHGHNCSEGNKNFNYQNQCVHSKPFPKPSSCSGFRTQEQESYAANPSGTNAAMILQNNFNTALEKTAKLTTNFRFKLTTDFRSKLTSGFRSKLTT